MSFPFRFDTAVQYTAIERKRKRKRGGRGKKFGRIKYLDRTRERERMGANLVERNEEHIYPVRSDNVFSFLLKFVYVSTVLHTPASYSIWTKIGLLLFND